MQLNAFLVAYNAKTVNKKALDQSADTLLKNTLQGEYINSSILLIMCINITY